MSSDKHSFKRHRHGKNSVSEIKTSHPLETRSRGDGSKLHIEGLIPNIHLFDALVPQDAIPGLLSSAMALLC